MGKLLVIILVIAAICVGYWMWTHPAPAQPTKPTTQVPQKTTIPTATTIPTIVNVITPHVTGTPEAPDINGVPTDTQIPVQTPAIQNKTKTEDFINMCLRGYKGVDIADCAKCGIIIDPEDYKHIRRVRNVTCIVT